MSVTCQMHTVHTGFTDGGCIVQPHDQSWMVTSVSTVMPAMIVLTAWSRGYVAVA